VRIMPGGALEAGDDAAESSGGGAPSGATGRSSSSRAAAGGGPTSVFVGSRLEEHRGAFVLEHPMENGAVVDTGWDAMERLWEVRSGRSRLAWRTVAVSPNDRTTQPPFLSFHRQ